MVFRTLKPNNNKSHCTENSATQSPIILPKQEQCVACSLGCDIKFDYMRADDWSMSIVRVIDDTFQSSDTQAEKKSILRYYVNNYGAHPSKDITFNSNHYQLEFIEFYLPAIHRMPKDTDDSATNTNPPTSATEQHDLELVMCHRLVSTSSQTTRWVNVSVFVKEQDSYSLTNTFFQQLINTVLVSSNENVYNSSHLSEDSTSYIPNISWTTPVRDNGSQEPVERKGHTNGSPAVRLDVGSNWTPYHALPTNKAFYSYLGEFVYAPCTFEATDKVTWVIMNQPVSMHNSEYKVLQHVIKSQSSHKFDYNKGTSYTAIAVATGRNIMYNNGEMVVGNQDQDKIIIKCTKRKEGDQQQPNQPNSIYDSQMEETRTMQDKDNTARNKTSLYTTFQPPTTTMLTIVSCILISAMFFIIFASSNWIHQTAGEMADKKEHVQYGITLFITLALFVLCALSFVLASSVVVGFQPFGILLWTVVLLFWTSYPMKFMMRKSSDWYLESTVKKVFSWFLYITAILIWLSIIHAGFLTAFAPCFFLNGSAHSTYTYYFTTGYGDNETFYIGKRAVMVMNFAGYRLNYYQENTTIFDDNCMVLPDGFMDLYGHLRIETVITGPLPITGEQHTWKSDHSKENEDPDKFVDALESKPLLEKYDSLMKQDNSRPLDNLIEAVQTTLLANKQAERMTNERKTGWQYEKDQEKYSTTVTYKLDNVDTFKTSLKTRNPKLFAFLSSPTVV